MSIHLLKKFYSVNDLVELLHVSRGCISERIKNMGIEPDIQIDKINHYCEHSKNRIVGIYEFEKSFQDILYFERNQPKDKFAYFESEMNKI